MKRKMGRRQIADFVRSPKLEDVALEDLKDDRERVTDGHFNKLYRRYALGNLQAILTRIDLEKIHPGVFLRSSDGQVQQFDTDADYKHVDWMCYDIRRGFRPALFLYKGIFGKSRSGYVCSDDVLNFNAYKKLGIRKVPAIILGKPNGTLEESGICVQVRSGRLSFASIVAAPRERMQTVLGENNKLSKFSPVKAIGLLKRRADHASACIKAFHIEAKASEQIHYHHCLHSVTYRISEALGAIKLLLANNLEYQMRPLVRSTYELFLNFYIDWLSPEHVGLLLQGLAALNREDRSTAEYQSFKKSIRDAFGGLVDVCGNASEKGRLSPLGSFVHSRLYPGLSAVVHQDFGVTSDYGRTLDTGRTEKMHSQEMMENIRWLDLIVAATFTRVMDDVGAYGGKLKKWPNLDPSRLRRVAVLRQGTRGPP